jgi:hypothetical protein
MYLHARETGLRGQSRRVGELPHRLADLGHRHLARGAEDQLAGDGLEDAVAQPQRHGAGCQVLLEETPVTGAVRRLPAGVVDLHDRRRSIAGGCVACPRPGLPGLEQAGLGDLPVDGRVGGAAEVGRVHLHVARQDHAPPALGPGRVDRVEGGVWEVVLVGHLLCHGGFDEPVGEGQPARQGYGLRELEVCYYHFFGVGRCCCSVQIRKGRVPRSEDRGWDGELGGRGSTSRSLKLSIWIVHT